MWIYQTRSIRQAILWISSLSLDSETLFDLLWSGRPNPLWWLGPAGICARVVARSSREGNGVNTMEAHFVRFLSPGIFVSEESTVPIDHWNVETAMVMARDIKERHGAVPYGFQFITRSRGPDDLDSKITERSGIYYLGGRIETLAQVEARNVPNEDILRSNMRNNDWDKIIINTNSWKVTFPLNETDVMLEWTQ